MASIQQYKIPRSQVDVEGLAQEFFKYFRISVEDTEVLHQDPARRDALIAELYASPAVKPSFMAADMVGENPTPAQVDQYLAAANAGIARLTPPQSLEERVLRLHIASAAVNVLGQYKLRYALQDHYDLKSKVVVRYTKLLDDWTKKFLSERSSESSGKAISEQAMRTPSTPQTPLSPPPTQHRGKAKAISADEIACYLNNAHTLLRKQFEHSPPPGGEEDYKGLWSLESYTTRVREDQIDHEFVISLGGMDRAAVPMGREEVRYLLTYSTLA
ncbi:hypothetical protein BD414DRAFT_278019 [Trametes punicea]|nr:hypothetical protein BD414DRAFT_278019 [Trametes punicea]